MASLAGILLPTILILALSPWLIPFSLRQIGALVGVYIVSKSSARRETLLAASRSPSVKPRQSLEDDDDWEKVGRETHTTTKEGLSASKWNGVVGFFHPFCNAGGGGERVLWAAIRATQTKWPDAVCVVYTGDHDAAKEQIIKRVQDRFNIELNPKTLHFLYLSTRNWVLASTWPRFTLLGQSLGSLVLALDAFTLLVPDIFVDTMGYAFSLWLCKFLFPKVPTGAYVHYPTISTDMLESLDSASEEHGVNAGAGRGTKGKIKRTYWKCFAGLYSRVGGSIDVVMTNSSWTQSHITQLWGPCRRDRKRKAGIELVFPPVAVEELEQQIDISAASEQQRKRHLLYIAQFRPEKNHNLIVNAFAAYINSRTWTSEGRPKLVLVGSVRDSDDSTRVYKLRLHAHEMQIKNDVDFVLNASWPQVLDHLRRSSVGVNGMWNEHFGIGVVEYQAAGLVSVVNDSGGPKADIVVDIDGAPTGYHASTVDEYAAAFEQALSLKAEDTVAMRLRARKSAQRFTEAVFAEKWVENMEILVTLQSGR